MAMAQQQQQSYLIHSSSGSSSGSVMPVSLTSSISTGNSVSLTNRTVTSQSSQQQLSSETKPTLQMALKSMTTSSCEHEIAGAGGKLEQRGSREIEEEDGDDNASKESSSTHNSDQNKSQAPISKYYHKSEFVAATTSSSKTLTATPAASIPNNFILTSGTNQTSSHVSKPSEVGPNLSSLQTSNVLNAAISNPLNAAISNPLLTGLNLFTVPGIGTPTGSLAGLVSPVLFTNNINPFLAVLGSSPNLLKFAPVTTTKSSPVGGVINTATAAAPVISYAPNQQASGVTSPQNLQLLSQLQERINAHLQSSTTLLTDSSTSLQRDMNNLLCLPRAGVSALEAASLSATSVLDQELSKRERKLELLAMGKSPVHCIASPPEILWSRHGALPSEHTIEYIDTLQLKVQSSRGSGPALESNYSIGKRAVSSRTGISNSNHEELTREIRNSGGSRKGCLEELPSESKPSNNSATRSDYHLNLLKLKPSKSHLTDSHSHLTSLSLPNTTVKTIPSSPLQADSSNLVSATISSPSSTQMSRLSTLQVAATPSEVKTSSVVTSLSSVPSATPMTPAVIPAGFPLIYAVPPTTAAATATHGLRTTPLASSPLRGDFYVMLNPSAATSGVGTCGSTTMQSLMIAAAPALATSTTSASVKHSPAELGVLPLQVPRLASGATGLIPSLGTTLSPVRAPMYYYIPNGGGSFQPTAAASVNAGLGTVAGRTPVTIGGTREDEEGKKSHTHHHGPSISQSSLLQAARTKKRPQSDLGETQFSKSEAKRMRMNATDIPWTNVKHQSEGPLCLRDVKVDCEEESGVADGAKAEECATASDTDDEVAVADMMFTHGGEGNKPFSCKSVIQ